MFKQLYHILALLAILHLLVLGGLIGWLIVSGKLDAEKARNIAAVMRGELPAAPTTTAPATSRPVIEAQPVLAQASTEKIERERNTDELNRLLDDRRRREIADRQNLIDAAMLRITRERESFAKEVSDFEKAQKATRLDTQGAGLERELTILSGISGKAARDVLMKKSEPDAVQLLLSMKPRTATDIVESCKTEEQKTWAVKILQEVANVDKGRAQQMARAVQ